MVLRELKLRGVTDFDGLIDAFLAPHNEWARCVAGTTCSERSAMAWHSLSWTVSTEIGGRGAREDLRRAVFDGLEALPGLLLDVDLENSWIL